MDSTSMCRVNSSNLGVQWRGRTRNSSGQELLKEVYAILMRS